MKTKVIALATLLVFMGGCATGVDPNYKMRLEAQLAIESRYADAEKEKYKADQMKYAAIQKIGETGDTTAKAVAMMALMGGNGSNGPAQQRSQMPLPQHETTGDAALKWVSALGGPTAMLISGYFGYKLGETQSNNAAASTIAGYNAFGTVANSGFGAATQIANAGFASNGVLAGQIQPNITLSGTGVIGAGTMTSNVNSNNRTCAGGNGVGGISGTVAIPGTGGNANC